jgi:hypothetical protein
MATPIIKIVPMPGIQVAGPAGVNGVGVPTGGSEGQVLAKASNNNYDTEWVNAGGSGVSSTVPFELTDTNNDVLLSITQTNVGTTRIETPQDDLSLRSARDITLYPGSDGPGKVYIGWGDAQYTPNSGNEVATKGYVDDATGASAVKYRVWGYPTNDAIAIMPTTDNESIALKSSDAAAIRWHVRNNTGSMQLLSATVTAGDGYQVIFTINEQNSVPATGAGKYYQINCPNNSAYNGAFIAISATTTTLTFIYESDPGVFDPTDASISQPSVYSQFEVDSDGAHVKIADWTSGPGGYSQQWDFTKEGAIHFPYGPSNQRTGYGDVLRFATSFDQSIITGAPATEGTPNANRLVIAGQDGYDGTGYDGEGGDIYLWAGIGGGTTGGGGDIKIDAGNGAVDGNGGYVKIRGGYSETVNGGYVNIDAGDSNTGSGGYVNIRAGENINGTGSGGQVYIQGGYSADPTLGGDVHIETSQSGKIVLAGAGGEFLNDATVSNNQIATIGHVATAKSTFERINVYYETPVSVDLSHVGSLLYAAVAGDTFATYQIPTNASVAFPIGSEIKFATNGGSVWFISAIDTEITTLIGEGSNGYTGINYNFIVPTNSTATLLKVDTDRWILSGLRLTD